MSQVPASRGRKALNLGAVGGVGAGSGISVGGGVEAFGCMPACCWAVHAFAGEE